MATFGTMVNIAVLIVSITVATFILASTVYTIYQIRKFKTLMSMGTEFFQIRHPSLTAVYIIGFLSVFYIFNPSILLLCNILNTSKVHIYLIYITDSIISFLIYPRIIIFCFDRAFVDRLRNWIWRREINHTDINFFIKYRCILQYAHLIILTSYAFIILPLFITLHVYSESDHFVYIILIVCVSITFALTLYFAVNINNVTDEYCVKEETVTSLSIIGPLYILTHIIHYICFHVVATPSSVQWGVIAHILLNSAISTAALYYACIWSTNKYLFQTLLIGPASDKSTKRVQFKNIMDYRAGVESFCNHLSREFGLESILFLIEVTQFKSFIHGINPAIADNICKLVHIDHSNIFTVHISKIQWLPCDPRMYTQTPYQVALHLYDKYIEQSADLCINISYMNRNTIYREFQSLAQKHMDHEDLSSQNAYLERMFRLFDDSFAEIWTLIAMDSYRRYRTTDECDRLIVTMNVNNLLHTRTHSKKASDLKIHMNPQQSIKYLKQTTHSPEESTESDEKKQEHLDVVPDLPNDASMSIHRANTEVMDQFKDVFTVDESGNINIINEAGQKSNALDPYNVANSLLGLKQSQSQPKPQTHKLLNATPRLSLQPSSEPSAFAEQNVAQRTKSLRTPHLRSRAASIELPRPTTYRYLIKTESLKPDPKKSGVYFLKSNNQTNHLTSRSFSVHTSSDQVISS